MRVDKRRGEVEKTKSGREGEDQQKREAIAILHEVIAAVTRRPRRMRQAGGQLTETTLEAQARADANLESAHTERLRGAVEVH